MCSFYKNNMAYEPHGDMEIWVLLIKVFIK